MAAKLDAEEIAKEIFAASGFNDGARFLKKKEDGEEELTQEDLDAAHQEGIEAGVDQAKMAEVEMRREVEFAKLELQREMGYAQLAVKENMTMAQLQNKMDIDLAKDKSRRDVAAAQEQTKRELLINQREELKFKKDTGKPGI